MLNKLIQEKNGAGKNSNGKNGMAKMAREKLAMVKMAQVKWQRKKTALGYKRQLGLSIVRTVTNLMHLPSLKTGAQTYTFSQLAA